MISRYRNTRTINVNDENSTKRVFASSFGLSKKIRDGIRNGNIDFITRVISTDDRLDTLAGQQYGDSSLWWVIAAANGIGYAMQIREGSELIVPTNIEQIAAIV